MKKIIMFLIYSIYLNAQIYFISPDGNDSNMGSIDKPFKTLLQAIKVVKPNDIVNIREGNYTIKNRFNISGTEDKPITFQAYKDENVSFIGTYTYKKKFDLNSNAYNNTFLITGDYLIFKNFEVKNGANGIYIKGGSHNILKNLSLHDNYYSGLIISDGASYNKIINCDSFHNFDSNTHGQHADGFVMVGHKSDKIKHVGEGNIFINCRSWGNADDGYDCWQSGNPITFINCLSFDNGYNIWHQNIFQGDGNGFKLGVHNKYNHAKDAHIVINCKAWNNKGRGFDFNDNKIPITMFRNISYKNQKSGFKFLLSKHKLIQNINIDSAHNYIDHHKVYEVGNSWNKKDYNIKADIISFDDSSIKSKRDKNGNFISNYFLELKLSSKFYDKNVTDNYSYLIDIIKKYKEN